MKIPVNKRIILDLYAGTGAATDPYAEAGYDRRKITLPNYDVRTYKPPLNVYGIWASPVCKEFSLAKGNRPRDFEGAMDLVKAALRIIWQCRLSGSLAFWCLENPRGFLRQFLGKPPLTVHYWEFGDLLDKPTDLWGYFNFPKKKYKEPAGPLRPMKNIPGNRKIERGIIPPCFANAFFKANR